MAAQLGVNVDAWGHVPPDQLRSIGAIWARAVVDPSVDLTEWITSCHDRNVRVLLVLARESIGNDPARWQENIQRFLHRYWHLVDAWQVGNEPDSHGESSWTQSHVEHSRLLKVARDVLGPDAYLIGGGLASGDPTWTAYVDYSHVNAIACHPYAKDPGSPELDWLLGEYAAYRTPLWCTEYHARSIGMAAALRDDPRVTTALAFCYSDAMVPGFGMIEDPRAAADFIAAAAGQQSNVPEKPRYRLGFQKWAKLEPRRLGAPVRNERNVGHPGWQVQRTKKGILSWVDGRGHIFVRDDGRVWQWQEDWPKSVEVRGLCPKNPF